MRGIQVIFSKIHALASHGKTLTVRRKWKSAENKLYKRLCPNLWKAIQLGIRREII